MGWVVKVMLVGSLLAAAAPLQAKLAAPGHTPKINTHWNYTLTVTRGGKPAAAKITAQIVDPIGGKHTVEFGKNTKLILNWPIKGVFRDYIIWPPTSRGIPLKLQFTIKAPGVTKIISYSVVPHA